jgi:hypothetical protein
MGSLCEYKVVCGRSSAAGRAHCVTWQWADLLKVELQ